MTDANPQREVARERTEAYRERRRHGRVLVQVEVSLHHLAALERLALLDSGEREKACIAWAVERFLDAAPQALVTLISGGQPVIFVRNGRPVAVVMDVDSYEEAEAALAAGA